MMEKSGRRLHPGGLPEPAGLYSHAMKAGGFLFLCGQSGRDSDGSLALDLEGQLKQTFRNIGAILASEGLTFRSVVKFTTYVVDKGHIAEFHQVRSGIYEEVFPSGDYPPNTLLVVTQLAVAELLVEVETVAFAG